MKEINKPVNEQVKKYYLNNYLEYQMRHGEISKTSMAKQLGISPSYLVSILKGRRGKVSRKIAQNSALVFRDPSILHILGYNADPLTQTLLTFSPAFTSALMDSVKEVDIKGISGTYAADQLFVYNLLENASRSE